MALPELMDFLGHRWTLTWKQALKKTNFSIKSESSCLQCAAAPSGLKFLSKIPGYVTKSQNNHRGVTVLATENRSLAVRGGVVFNV